MRSFISFVVCVLAIAPCDAGENLPTAPPYWTVSYAASDKPGELQLGVTYTAWLPPGVKTIRGVIVHQHGCGV